MNRRDIIRLFGTSTLSYIIFNRNIIQLFGSENKSDKKKTGTKTVNIFNSIIQKSSDEKWYEMPIGELMHNIALMLVGTPYQANTLEGDGPEICRIYFEGLDCVTFFENVFCLARIIKKGKTGIEDLYGEVTFTRYRDGIITDYSSRLHYTADWIYDNVKKNVVEDITEKLGGKPLSINVSFMSQNPGFYPSLKNDKTLISKIIEIENQINERMYYYIPIENVRNISDNLNTGDIVAIATSTKRLDYSHTGLIVKEKNIARFIHASSKKKKVVIDDEIYKYLKNIKGDIGITVLRPLEV